MKTFTVVDGASVERILGVQPTLDHLWASFRKTGRLRQLQVSWMDGEQERVVRGDRFFGLVNSEKDLTRAAGMELVHVETSAVLDMFTQIAKAEFPDPDEDDVRSVITDKHFTAFQALLVGVMDTKGIVFAKKEPS